MSSGFRMVTPKIPIRTSTSGEPLFIWGRRTYVMGVINLTPDSFSEDGIGDDVNSAVALARRFQEEGADILDIGAQSTRPGYRQISEEEEIYRLIPALEAIVSAVKLPISVDAYRTSVARRALIAGATVLNHIWGVDIKSPMLSLAAEWEASIILMHNQAEANYTDVVTEVRDSLLASAERAHDLGISRENIILDPGIGFGKTARHNLKILKNLKRLTNLGYPVLVGTSRKSTIGKVLDLPVTDRLEGTAATVALAIAGGTDIVRVHDVRAMVRVAKMSDAIVRSWQPPT